MEDYPSNSGLSLDPVAGEGRELRRVRITKTIINFNFLYENM